MDDSDNQAESQTGTEPKKNDKLEEVKQRAMQALVPVMKDLDGIDPERRFDICLTAMRYSDDADLAGVALDAALAIEDNGPKAEALVSLINEINYLEQA